MSKKKSKEEIFIEQNAMKIVHRCKEVSKKEAKSFIKDLLKNAKKLNNENKRN